MGIRAIVVGALLVAVALAPAAWAQGPLLDLSWSSPDAPDRELVEGGSASLAVEVRNDGTEAARNVTLNARVTEPGLSVRPPVQVTLGLLQPGTSATAQFTVVADLPGNHSKAIELVARGENAVAHASTAGFVVLALPRPEVSAAPVALERGVPGVLAVRVRNAGDLPLEGIAVNLTPAAGVETPNGTTASVESLEGGAELEVPFVLNASREGDVDIRIDVASRNGGAAEPLTVRVPVAAPPARLPVVEATLKPATAEADAIASYAARLPAAEVERRVLLAAPEALGPLMRLSIVLPAEIGLSVNVSLLDPGSAAAPPLPPDALALALVRVHMQAVPEGTRAPLGEAATLALNASVQRSTGLPGEALVLLSRAGDAWQVIPSRPTTWADAPAVLAGPFSSGIHAVAARDAQPPILAQPFPIPGAEVDASVPLTVAVNVYDNVGVDARSIAFSVAGTPLAGAVFDGRRAAAVLATTLPPGPVDLGVSARDRFGNEANLTWTVTLVTPEVVPEDRARIAGARPQGTVVGTVVNVTADFDLPEGRELEAVTMSVDGRDISDRVLVNRSTVLVSALRLDPGPHTVVLRLEDSSGTVSEESWQFVVQRAGPPAVSRPVAVLVALVVTGFAAAFVFAIPKVVERRGRVRPGRTRARR